VTLTGDSCTAGDDGTVNCALGDLAAGQPGSTVAVNLLADGTSDTSSGLVLTLSAAGIAPFVVGRVNVTVTSP